MTMTNASAINDEKFLATRSAKGWLTTTLSIRDFTISIPIKVAIVATTAVTIIWNGLFLIFLMCISSIPTIRPITMLPIDHPGNPLKPSHQ